MRTATYFIGLARCSVAVVCQYVQSGAECMVSEEAVQVSRSIFSHFQRRWIGNNWKVIRTQTEISLYFKVVMKYYCSVAGNMKTFVVCGYDAQRPSSFWSTLYS